MNTERTSSNVTLTLRHDATDIHEETINFANYTSKTYNLSDSESFGTEKDTIGTLSIGPSTIDNFVGYLVRERFTDSTNQTFDFAMPTPVR